ncbi:MAG: hypothetical protein K2H35_03980, partial [Muribaculaceae bacterium]|nr:hypothetical protein [Muribaculaceae bacterium]
MGQITESASQWKINECLNYNSETSTSLQESKNDSKNRTTLFRNFKRLSPTTRALAPRQWYNEGFMSEADFDRHIREECYDLELKIAECLLN